jgi:NADPH:quinone reductase-like Zn-dependent oxidoreductase
MHTMKAITYKKYGQPEVLTLSEVKTPNPSDDELLIRIRASTVNTADWRMRSLEVPRGFGLFVRLAFGIFGPRKQILGCELAGEVEAIGSAVTHFKVGDPVVAYPGFDLGCHAQYKCIKASGAVALKPANLSFEQACALCFGGATMLDFFQRAKLKKASVCWSMGLLALWAVRRCNWQNSRVLTSLRFVAVLI